MQAVKSMRARRLGKLPRRVEDLFRQMSRCAGALACAPRACVKLWAKCKRTGQDLLPQCDVFASICVPDVACTKALSEALKCEVQREHASVRVGLLKAWQLWLQEDWSKTGTNVYQWCKGLRDEAAAMILRPDGTLTCNAAEADELLRASWLPIFQMYDKKDKPTWQCFFAEFGKYIAAADA